MYVNKYQQRNFHIQEQSMHKNLDFFRADTDQSAKPTDQVDSVDPLSTLAKLAKTTIIVG